MVSSITLDPYSIEKSPEVTSLAMVIFATPGCPISSYFTLQIGELDRFGLWEPRAAGHRERPYHRFGPILGF